VVAEEGDRALERALARESVLVLPRATYELEPSLEYIYRGSDALELVEVAGTAQVARQSVNRDRLEARLGLRVGLPGAAHVEVRAPYLVAREERTIAGQISTSTNVDGVGDLELGITKELVAERNDRPGWLGTLNWRLPTGRFRLGELSAGSGFHTLQAGLTLVRRQDPLVLFGTGTYNYVRERTHEGVAIDPGNAVGMRLGAILAASPQTSLRAAFELTRSARTTLNGAKVPGSDTVAATLQLGLGMLVTARSLLDVQVRVGVTPDAPDFVITAALPIRFP
jgi:hypothetical protein